MAQHKLLEEQLCDMRRDLDAVYEHLDKLEATLVAREQERAAYQAQQQCPSVSKRKARSTSVSFGGPGSAFTRPRSVGQSRGH